MNHEQRDTSVIVKVSYSCMDYVVPNKIHLFLQMSYSVLKLGTIMSDTEQLTFVDGRNIISVLILLLFILKPVKTRYGAVD